MNKILSFLGIAAFAMLYSSCGNSAQTITDKMGVDSAEKEQTYFYPDTAALRKKHTVVRFETTKGIMEFALFDVTSKHRANFLKLCKEHFYDGLLFHRVIKDFMTQGGDPTSRRPNEVDTLGMGEIGYGIPAEFIDTLHHFKGALCAARKPDIVNPQKMSSACQFYIVWGRKLNKQEFLKEDQAIGYYFQSPEGKDDQKKFYEFARNGNKLAQNQLLEIAKKRGLHMLEEVYLNMPDKTKEAYAKWGGAPLFDGLYTVFGFLIKGYDVLEEINNVPVNELFRPTEEVKILSARVIKE